MFIPQTFKFISQRLTIWVYHLNIQYIYVLLIIIALKSIKKIVAIGPESSGKSTICEDLAFHFEDVFVPEFARTYLANRTSYVEKDLISIAKGQIDLEEKLQKRAKHFLFCDTDLQVIRVWSEIKYNRCHEFILNEIATKEYDAYLLTSPDFNWVYDPQRETPNEDLRKILFKTYKQIIIDIGKPFIILEGRHEKRMQDAICFIQNSFNVQ
jgi:NadR type nicotinamide-nucleotide adenylyltransferase